MFLLCFSNIYYIYFFCCFGYKFIVYRKEEYLKEILGSEEECGMLGKF